MTSPPDLDARLLPRFEEALSRHVFSGARLLVTHRGQTVADLAVGQVVRIDPARSSTRTSADDVS